MQTKLLIEQHIHGAFGVDFNKAAPEDILYFAKELVKYGIGGFFPTLVTDNIMNIKHQIEVIKKAAAAQTSDMAKILGIHLEGIFLNAEKCGVHNPKYFLPPTIENYQKVEDPFIKIVTLAPEFDEGLIDYLNNRKVKVQAGHCISGHLNGVQGVTHLFNAMSGIPHRGKSTSLSALMNDNIYTEIICDGLHISDEALKLVFHTKPADKIILVSDSLPIAKSSLTEMIFSDSKVYYNGVKATTKEGTIAGSTALLPDMIKWLHTYGLFNPQYIKNPYNYHEIDLPGHIEWDDEWNILEVVLK